MDLSEADYMKILEYIVSKDSQKAVKYKGLIYVVSKDAVMEDLYLRAYRSAPTAKKYFENVRSHLSNLGYSSRQHAHYFPWLLSPEELIVQADLAANA